MSRTVTVSNPSKPAWWQRREYEAYRGVEPIHFDPIIREAETLVAKPKTKDYLYDPPPRPSREDELRRLARHGRPINWHSPYRQEFVDQGLVRVTYTHDGRWAGDEITEEGHELVHRHAEKR